MRAELSGKFLVLIITLYLFGCGGGGVISLPSGGYCTDDGDCNTADGYVCVLTTSYDYKTCQLPVKPTECPSVDGGEVDAGYEDGGRDEDAGSEDAATPDDAGEEVDASTSDEDAGTTPHDAGHDAGPHDAGATPSDAGSNPADGGTPDAGGTIDAGPPAVFRIDNELWEKVGEDVFVFTWDTNYPATGDLYLGSTLIESETSLKFNHALTHQFASGVHSFKVESSTGASLLSFSGTVTVAARPDTAPLVVVISRDSVTQTSAEIRVLYTSKPLADQTLSCGPDAQHLTARPSGTVGSDTIPLSGLTPDTSYTCQLGVHDTTPAHNAGTSNLVTFRTNPVVVDLAPAFISVFALQSAGQQDAVLSWNSNKLMVTPMTGEYWTGSASPQQVSLRPGGMSGTIMIPGTNLLPDTVYSIKVSGFTETGVASEGQGTFRTALVTSPVLGVTLSLPTATHPSTSILVNWSSFFKTVKAVQVKCGLAPGVFNLTLTSITTGLPGMSGVVTLTGLNSVTTYHCQITGVDQYNNVTAPDSLQRDLFTFTTWHTPTTKIVCACAPNTGSTTASVYWQSTDFATSGSEVQLTVSQACTGNRINQNPQEKMHVTCDASITNPGLAARCYQPRGSPILYNGSPILPLTADSNYRGRAVLNTDVIPCSDLGQ